MDQPKKKIAWKKNLDIYYFWELKEQQIIGKSVTRKQENRFYLEISTIS